MSIKLRIILLSLIGNIAIAAVFLTLAQYQTSQKDQTAIESSATVYGQAWRTVLNDSFDNSVGFFHPQSGDMDKITIWQVDTTAEDPPVLVDFLETEEVGVDLKEYLDQYFEDAFGWGELSFVMLFDRGGVRLYCGTAYEGLGIDPCAEEAKPEFISSVSGKGIQELKDKLWLTMNNQ